MTLANAKRLYAHYVAIGKNDAAEDMLRVHPELRQAPAKKK